MNEQCIINVGFGGGYSRGTARLINSITKYPDRADCMTWVNSLPSHSPRHADHPYGFKPYAFKAAIEAGHRYVLWCDSSVWAVNDPQPVFDTIRSVGWYFIPAGWHCGQWTTDKSLELLGISRDEAMTMPDFCGSCMGIDTQNEISAKWFEKWLFHAKSGAFSGDWKNDRHQCSRDPRCLGHRHDQVIGSILMNQAGMTFNDQDLFQYPPQGWPGCAEKLHHEGMIFLNQGGSW